MTHGTEYTGTDLHKLATAEVKAVRVETAAPARLVDYLIGGVGTDKPYLKVLIHAYDGLRQRHVAI